MNHPLVVTDPSERAPELIREAGELAEAADAPLSVLTVVTREEFNNDADVLESVADRGIQWEYQNPAEYAVSVADRAVSDLLEPFDIETESIGRGVEAEDKRADAILEVADEVGCDYIFLIGRRRSPTGKVIFGDTAQQVILTFDGYVVTLMD